VVTLTRHPVLAGADLYVTSEVASESKVGEILYAIDVACNERGLDMGRVEILTDGEYDARVSGMTGPVARNAHPLPRACHCRHVLESPRHEVTTSVGYQFVG
jgi:hypothetical protein